MSGVGTMMQQQQQKAQMKRYNNQVNSQNALLTQQYADRTRRINEARDESARSANEMSAAQRLEFEKQTRMADEKAQSFQTATQDNALRGANSDAFAEGVAKRNQLFNDTDMPADYSVPNSGGTENRVVQAANEKAMAKSKTKTAGVADAAARMASLQDAGIAQNDLFRDIGVKLNDAGDRARSSSAALTNKMRLPQYHMQAVTAAAGDNAAQPYFRGEEPQYKPPNTMFADIFTGGGGLLANYAFRQPQPIRFSDITWN